MATASLTSTHLDAFRSFCRERLDLSGITVLTRRSSAGRSNALDAVEVLARLAEGDDLHEALDGRGRDGGAVLGGARGCAPHGTTSFSLGCTVASGKDLYRMTVTTEVEPVLRITEERLWGPAPAAEPKKVGPRWLMGSRPGDPDRPGLTAETHNGKRGNDPARQLRDDRLLTLQLAGRMNPKDRIEAAVLRGAEAVTSALRGAFHLDPVPHLMRGHVPERDVLLGRTAENIPAAVPTGRVTILALMPRSLPRSRRLPTVRSEGSSALRLPWVTSCWDWVKARLTSPQSSLRLGR